MLAVACAVKSVMSLHMSCAPTLPPFPICCPVGPTLPQSSEAYMYDFKYKNKKGFTVEFVCVTDSQHGIVYRIIGKRECLTGVQTRNANYSFIPCLAPRGGVPMQTQPKQRKYMIRQTSPEY